MNPVEVVFVGGPCAGERRVVDADRYGVEIPETTRPTLDFAPTGDFIERPDFRIHRYQIMQPFRGFFVAIHDSFPAGDWKFLLSHLLEAYANQKTASVESEDRERKAKGDGLLSGLSLARNMISALHDSRMEPCEN